MMLIPSQWIWLIPIVGYFCYKWFKDWIRITRFALSVPGPFILPIIGNSFTVRKNSEILDWLNTAYSKYGPIVRGWTAFRPIIFVFEPKYIQLILGSSKSIEKELFYDVLDGILGHGLILENGRKWKFNRKCIQPHFNIHILQKYIPSFLKCSEMLIKNLQNSKDLQKVKITSLISSYLSDVSHEIVLGISVDDYITKGKSPFVKGRNTSIERLTNNWLAIDFVYTKTDMFEKSMQQQRAWTKFISKILGKMESDSNMDEVSNRSILRLFAETSNNTTEFQREDVVEEACTFMLAGQDSTAVTLSFTLYYLAKHQDIQDKAMEELNRLYLQSTTLDITTLNELKYLEQCIKESMRLSPAVPIVARKLLEDVKLDDYVVPAGCNVFICSYATHRLPHFYPNPEQYDPERFSAEHRRESNNFAFIPFSAGPRICIGAKLAMLGMKVALATILKNYKIHLVPGSEQLIPIYRITLKAKGGIWLHLEPRGPTD